MQDATDAEAEADAESNAECEIQNAKSHGRRAESSEQRAESKEQRAMGGSQAGAEGAEGAEGDTEEGLLGGPVWWWVVQCRWSVGVVKVAVEVCSGVDPKTRAVVQLVP
jgi:hypothetical protein